MVQFNCLDGFEKDYARRYTLVKGKIRGNLWFWKEYCVSTKRAVDKSLIQGTTGIAPIVLPNEWKGLC